MVDEQRRRCASAAQAYLLDAAEPTAVARGRARALRGPRASAAGAQVVRRAEQRLTMHRARPAVEPTILRLIEDIREGIHLQRYGGQDPLTEFQRQIIDAYAEMMDRVDEEMVGTFEQLRATRGEVDLAGAGIGGSSSTWTYLVNDNPFSTLGTSLLASRTLTYAVGVLALVYWPIALVGATTAFIRRVFRGRERRQAIARDRNGDGSEDGNG